jgi:hypothetical protein
VALPKTQDDDRARLRPHQVQPPCRPLPTTRQIRRPVRMATDHRHPQPNEAPPPPDSDTGRLRTPRRPPRDQPTAPGPTLNATATTAGAAAHRHTGTPAHRHTGNAHTLCATPSRAALSAGRSVTRLSRRRWRLLQPSIEAHLAIGSQTDDCLARVLAAEHAYERRHCRLESLGDGLADVDPA